VRSVPRHIVFCIYIYVFVLFGKAPVSRVFLTTVQQRHLDGTRKSLFGEFVSLSIIIIMTKKNRPRVQLRKLIKHVYYFIRRYTCVCVCVYICIKRERGRESIRRRETKYNAIFQIWRLKSPQTYPLCSVGRTDRIIMIVALRSDARTGERFWYCNNPDSLVNRIYRSDIFIGAGRS